jgi:hypothetical protein
VSPRGGGRRQSGRWKRVKEKSREKDANHRVHKRREFHTFQERQYWPTLFRPSFVARISIRLFCVTRFLFVLFHSVSGDFIACQQPEWCRWYGGNGANLIVFFLFFLTIFFFVFVFVFLFCMSFFTAFICL